MKKKTGKPRSPVHTAVTVLLTILIVILIAAAALTTALTALEYRPADSEPLSLEGSASASFKAGSTFTIMTWNIGYGALGDNSDFFMDGGSMVKTADAERVYENLYGMLGEIRSISPDILFLQEVDLDSSRSYHIDQKAFFAEALPGMESSFAVNYRAAFVPYPLPPLGKVEAGIMTMSRYTAASAERVQLPVPFSWPVRAVNLKRCLDIERFPVENSDNELVLINLHLEAYDSGEGKIAQTNMLRDILQEEAGKGNYVIAGGDLNQIFSNADSSAYPVLEDRWQPGVIDVSGLGEGWQCVMDTAVPSCRSLDQPYTGADREHFQYYLIDGFIVSDNLDITDLQTRDLQFTCSDHNPVIMQIHIPGGDDEETAETGYDAAGPGTDNGSGDAGNISAQAPEAGVDPAAATEEAVPEETDREYDFTLGFAGDINFADNYIPVQHLDAIGSTDIRDGIDPRYIELMQKMDLMWINNEFAYSTRGEALPGKAFTFRASPSHAAWLNELGIDIVGLANNHVYDFGRSAFYDTLNTLTAHDIPYVGAGRSIEEAAAPVYLEADGFTIAYVAASRAEKWIFTPEATETEGGILLCVEFDRFLASIREAAENADYVIALPHWGTEHSTALQFEQTEGAHACIEAGADAVIGAHPHILQGIEYYQGKPILYSLGNFWFDNYDIDTVIAELHITGTTPAGESSLDGARIELTVYPGTQTGIYTWYADTEDWRTRILNYLTRISVNVTVGEDGIVRENKEE